MVTPWYDKLADSRGIHQQLTRIGYIAYGHPGICISMNKINGTVYARKFIFQFYKIFFSNTKALHSKA